MTFLELPNRTNISVSPVGPGAGDTQQVCAGRRDEEPCQCSTLVAAAAHPQRHLGCTSYLVLFI